MSEDFVFRYSWVLFLIPVCLFAVIWMRRRQARPTILYSSLNLLNKFDQTWKVKFQFLPFVCWLIALTLFLIALAGPRTVLEHTTMKAEGIDIVLALDASGSMAAEDFQLNGRRVNRLETVKSVVDGFIQERDHDRIALIAFAGLAYTVCPLTSDYDWLNENLERIEFGLIDDGTAIGSAIAASLSRLKNSEAKSKVIILLTDGENNSGSVDPIEAARIAKTLGVKIYTIGAGSNGAVPFPVQDRWGRKVYQRAVMPIDEKSLQEVATMTGGEYYRATDTESLKKIYDEIDRLEKVDIEEIGYFEYKEWFAHVLMIGLMFLILNLILDRWILMRIP